MLRVEAARAEASDAAATVPCWPTDKADKVSNLSRQLATAPTRGIANVSLSFLYTLGVSAQQLCSYFAKVLRSISFGFDSFASRTAGDAQEELSQARLDHLLRLPGSKGPVPIADLPPAVSALVVIDVQPCWWSEAGALRAAFPHTPEAISSLLKNARANKMPVVHIRSNYDASPHIAVLQTMHPTLNTRLPPPEAEPWAAELPGEPVVFKSRFDGFQNTDLKARLDELGVRRVYLCGLVTSACVLNTALGAFHHGLEPVVVADCTADRSVNRHKAALAMFRDYVLRVCDADEVPFEATRQHANEACAAAAAADADAHAADAADAAADAADAAAAATTATSVGAARGDAVHIDRLRQMSAIEESEQASSLSPSSTLVDICTLSLPPSK